MTRLSGIWKQLGIAKTGDRLAVKKAYAAKLREIDVDSEPARFEQLRDAYEQALDYVRYQQDAHHFEDNRLDQQAGAPLPSDGAGIAPVDTAPADVLDEEVAAYELSEGERAFGEIADILTHVDPDHSQLLSDEESETLVSEMGVLLDWVDTLAIDERAIVEYRLSYLLAQTIPASDAILGAVINHFGWRQAAREYDSSPAVREVVRRADANRIYSDLLNPSHRLHEAYRALTAKKKTNIWTHNPAKEHVSELIRAAYGDYPELKTVFHPQRMIEWENRLNMIEGTETGVSGTPWWAIILGIYFVLQLLAHLSRVT